MQKSNLISTLKSINSYELKKFELYLKGFYSKNAVLNRLFKYIYAYKPLFDSDSLDYEKLYRKVFPNHNSINKKKIIKLTSELNSILKEFLIWIELKNDKKLLEYMSIKVSQKRDLERFNPIGLRSKKITSTNDFGYKFMTYELEYSLNRKSTNIPLQRIIDNLDEYFIINKLKYYCEILHNDSIKREIFDYGYLTIEEILKYLRNKNFIDDISELYILSIELITKKNDENYDELLRLFKDSIGKVENNELIFVSKYLLKYASDKINKGFSRFRKHISFIHVTIIDNLLEENKINSNLYLNAIENAVKSGNLSYAEYLINSKTEILYMKNKENTLKIALAIVNFEKKEFNEVIKVLNSVVYTSQYIQIKVKILLLLSYFESDFPDEFLLTQFKSFDRMVRISNFNTAYKNGILNFTKIYKKYILVKYAVDNKKLSTNAVKKIKETLSNENVICRDWIEKKLNIFK